MPNSPLDRILLGDLVLDAHPVLLGAAASDAVPGPLQADVEVHAYWNMHKQSEIPHLTEMCKVSLAHEPVLIC